MTLTSKILRAAPSSMVISGPKTGLIPVLFTMSVTGCAKASFATAMASS